MCEKPQSQAPSVPPLSTSKLPSTSTSLLASDCFEKNGYKEYLHAFKEVCTRFLSNYMAWYKWLESFNDDKEIIRTKNILIHSVIPFVDTKIKEYKKAIEIG